MTQNQNTTQSPNHGWETLGYLEACKSRWATKDHESRDKALILYMYTNMYICEVCFYITRSVYYLHNQTKICNESKPCLEQISYIILDWLYIKKILAYFFIIHARISCDLRFEEVPRHTILTCNVYSQWNWLFSQW